MRESTQPSPMPGKQVELLHSATSYSLPSYVTGGKGLPVAMSAFPFVHSLMSLGSASWSRVGLLRGKIIGLSTCEAISWMTSFVNAFGFVDVPMSTCGLTSLMTERRSEWSLPSQSESLRAKGICACVSVSP